jgi:hypothetical protein
VDSEGGLAEGFLGAAAGQDLVAQVAEAGRRAAVRLSGDYAMRNPDGGKVKGDQRLWTVPTRPAAPLGSLS